MQSAHVNNAQCDVSKRKLRIARRYALGNHKRCPNCNANIPKHAFCSLERTSHSIDKARVRSSSPHCLASPIAIATPKFSNNVASAARLALLVLAPFASATTSNSFSVRAQSHSRSGACAQQLQARRCASRSVGPGAACSSPRAIKPPKPGFDACSALCQCSVSRPSCSGDCVSLYTSRPHNHNWSDT